MCRAGDVNGIQKDGLGESVNAFEGHSQVEVIFQGENWGHNNSEHILLSLFSA